MPVKSLFELASMACLKNIRELDTVGDLPYHTVRPILFRIDNAAQLRQIEVNSKQIQGETAEIWVRIIARDFPMESKSKAYKPQDPKNWHRVWEKYKKDHDKALEESEKKLMSALAGLRQDKEKNTSRIVDRKLLPRAGHVGPKRGWGQRDSAGSTITFGRGSRTKTVNGASVMRKVRREVKEIANIHGSLSRVTPRGPTGLTKLRKAPVSMVNARRVDAQPVFRPTPKEEIKSAAVAEYEERATYLSDSDDEEGDNDLFDEDDGFDEDERPAAPSPARKAVSQASASTFKRPASTSGGSSSKPVIKRSGILSNSYKPPAARPPTKPLVANSVPSKPAQPIQTPKPGPTKSSQVLPRTQNSPPPPPPPPPPRGSSSSPPPMSGSTVAADGPPRKRKAVNIFMSRKKRA